MFVWLTIELHGEGISVVTLRGRAGACNVFQFEELAVFRTCANLIVTAEEAAPMMLVGLVPANFVVHRKTLFPKSFRFSGPEKVESYRPENSSTGMSKERSRRQAGRRIPGL